MKKRLKEQMLNVPLDPVSRDALKRRAVANGRAMGREAARLIKQGLEQESAGNA